MADRSRALSKPHLYSLVAAAEVITRRGISPATKVEGTALAAWQERAWDYFDTVGEFRFGISWVSNALSRVNLLAARPPAAVGDEPSAIDPDDEDTTDDQRRAQELVEIIAGGASGQGQLLGEFGQHLGVAGFGWMVAEPDLANPDADTYETWTVLSQDALKIDTVGTSSKVMIRQSTGAGTNAWRQCHQNALVVKVWRKHPRRPWEPDSQVRSVLSVLEQLDLLNAHITATARSRLAGAGLLAIPAEAEFPAPPPVVDADGTIDPDQQQDGFDRFVDELTEMMTVPIRERDSAAAVVPLTLAIPGEFIDKLKHLSFATPFDDRVTELQQEAIKRLALGLDMPPEVLTGMGGVNHWTAWQVEETAITLHVEPAAEIVCNALTEGFLRPALEAEGIDPDTAIVWYDTGDLTSPPDKSTNAVAAYDRIQIGETALRRELGFAEDDAPTDDEYRQRVLLDVAKGAPTLAPQMLAAAGLLDPVVAEAAEEATPEASEDAPTAPLPGEGEPSGADGPPDASGRPGAAIESGLVLACDGVVYRALERAGSKLRNAIGRSTMGPQAVDCELATLHTRYDPTVHTDLDHLLDGSFDRVPELAVELGYDPDALVETLRAYCRSLLAAQHPHDRRRLASALGFAADG
jgi:hypothetical protein